jgi:hypothetical protein
MTRDEAEAMILLLKASPKAAQLRIEKDCHETSVYDASGNRVIVDGRYHCTREYYVTIWASNSMTGNSAYREVKERISASECKKIIAGIVKQMKDADTQESKMRNAEREAGR